MGGKRNFAKTKFIFKVKTDNLGTYTTLDTQFQLPLQIGSTVRATVDWGDGSSDFITAYDQTEILHTYSVLGTYTISISGTLNGFSFGKSGLPRQVDPEKAIELLNWGIFEMDSVRGAFNGCTNLIYSAIDKPRITTTDIGGLFNGNFAVGDMDLTNWNVSSVTDMDGVWYNRDAVTLNLTGWDTSNVTNMDFMFGQMQRLTTVIGINDLDVSNVTTMLEMFSYRDSSDMVSLDLSNWDTSSLLSVGDMFDGRLGLASLDIASWQVSQITNFGGFMRNCAGMTTPQYDATLIAWDAQGAFATSDILDFGGSVYTLGGAAETARTSLISKTGGSIIDGGGV
tara:strand:+ start:26713 stop:27732 length:1020 start_codon:yes stop_codon:yes gene_type:complete